MRRERRQPPFLILKKEKTYSAISISVSVNFLIGEDPVYDFEHLLPRQRVQSLLDYGVVAFSGEYHYMGMRLGRD